MATEVGRETGEITPVEEQPVEERPDFPDARLNPRFIVTRGTTRFVAYPGLLDLLHQLSEGFFAVETLVVQLPAADNGHVAVCTARVRIFDPQDADVVRRECSGIGDADPSNVSSQMRPHLLRMAETRAKARALRDAVNVGVASLEELGPESEARGEPERPAGDPSPRRPAPPTDRIAVGDRVFTREEVVGAYRKRLAQAKEAGLALGQGDLDEATAPLALLVGRSQELKRRMEAKAQGAPGAAAGT